MKRILMAMCVVLVASAAVLAFSWLRTDAEWEARLIEQVQQAKDVEALGNVYEKACANAWHWELKQLKKCQHPGIAIRAAWEEVLRAKPIYSAAPANAGVNSEAMQRFFGFLQDRLPVSLPSWWQATLAKAEYIGPDNRELQFREIPWNLFAKNKIGISTPKGTSIARMRNGWRFSADGETFELSESLIEQARATFPAVFDGSRSQTTDELISVTGFNAVPVDADRFLVAFYPNVPSSYSLFCVSRSSSKVAWESRIWKIWMRYGVNGVFWPDPHPTHIEVANGVVYVFGVDSLSAYIEAFSLADGKNLFRFSTSY